MDYKQMLKDYREFLQCDEEQTTDYKNMTQAEAEQALIDDINFIINTNKVDKLFETEKDLIIQLGGCSVCGSIPMTVNCNNANCDK